MKFLAAALAAILTTSDAISLKGRKLRKGALQNAIPVDKHGNRRVRKLEEEGEGEEEEEWQITNADSVTFNTCVSMKAYPDEDTEELMFNDFAEYTANGQIVSQKSMIIFNVCQTEYCGYDGEENLYMTDIGTFMGSILPHLQDQQESYCEACEEMENYCKYYQYGVDENGDALEEDEEEEESEDEDEDEDEDEEEGEDEDEEEGDEDEDRKRRRARRLAKKRAGRRLANSEYAECDTCASKSCWEEEQEEGEDGEEQEEAITLEDILEWAENMAECQETEYQWGDQNLYTGFMCNEDGTGVELAVFIDEDCSVYTDQKAFADVMDQDDYQLYSASADVVTFPFMNSFDCGESTEYKSAYNENGEEEEEEEEEEDDGEANEYCQNLFEEEDTLDLETCGADGDEEEEEEEEEYNRNYDIDWYSYTLTENDVEDAASVCKVVAGLEGEYEYGNYHSEGSGSFYDYTDPNASNGSLTPAQLFGVIIVVVGVVGIAIYSTMGASKKKDSKKTPLVSGKGGAMA